MRLKNYTDIDSGLIRDVIAFVRPAGIANFDVRISNHSNGHGCCGTAYSNGSGYHDTANPFIVIRLARADSFWRYFSKAEKGYLRYATGSRVEALVAVLAHELRHLWQSKHARGRVWGARGRFSERDADAYALHMLREFRRGGLVKKKEAL